MQKYFTNVSRNPLELIAGLCVLMVAASGAAVHSVASTALAVLFISSLFYVREWSLSWRSLEVFEKLVFIGFALYTLSGLLSYINANDMDEFVKQFGRYIRFTLIIPVYLVMRSRRLDLKPYFIAGIVLSGFVYLGFALRSLVVHPDMPASGAYHHITFGDAAMLNVGVMAVLLLKLIPDKKYLFATIVGVSLLSALYASLLSQARGAWIALPVFALLLVMYNAESRKSAAIKLIVVSVLMAVMIFLTPAGDVIEKRYDEAVTEVTQSIHGERFDTSIGGRLAMWDIAYQVWREHPIVGTGLGDFDEDMVRYQGMGKYPEIEVHGSAHNIFVQALMGTGLVGLLALCFALVIAPIVMFRNACKIDKAYAVMGVLLVASYAVFGLSESWNLRAPAISIYIAYMITLMCIITCSKQAA